MIELNFSKWHRWVNRNRIANINYPGVYAIAISKNKEHHDFSWDEIIYIGMTNSGNGLKGRLQQFDDVIKSGEGTHGGASRVYFKYRKYELLEPDLYVAIQPIKCDVKSNKPDDLRKMGDVAKLEYDCLADFVELHGHLPEFNDKKRSPKK